MENRNQVPEEMARVAAHWWAGLASGRAPHRTGDNGSAAALAGILADTMKKTPQENALEVFEKALANRIMTEERYMWGSIWVDYVPDDILCEAAKEAGISTMNFPWKTGMHIDPDRGTVTVRESLGPWTQIYPEYKEGG